MYEISIKTHFSAAHHLVGYEGACCDVHGHNWEVQVFVQGARLNALGMLVDFGAVRRAVEAALESMDHKDLNQLAAFTEQNPTSEHIARFLFEVLSEKLNTDGSKIARVNVCETPGSVASYWKAPGERAADD